MIRSICICNFTHRFAFRLLLVCCLLVVALSGSVVQAQEKKPATEQEPKEQTPKESAADDGHGDQEHTNRLVDETSPYLLLHAHNPVDWYPWGPEALAKASEENKPIFLSIGYSSCHWCHVMERESFLDEEIANFLNENFVCIKVDREERPDIDSIYMMSLNIFNQLTRSGRTGGWPLTMFMTPEGEPFFGGSYFPARDGDRRGAPGFLTIAQRVNKAWAENRDAVKKDAERLAEFTRAELNGRRDSPPGEIQPEWVQNCLNALSRRFDPGHGGFGFSSQNPNRPKFPEPSNLVLMLEICRDDAANQATSESARTMLEKTLDEMFQGGIYDHIGGGFHRYSVDRFWHIPHFEKMLYDNGQLMSVYAGATEFITDKPEYAQVCDEIFTFLTREMTAEQGGFYSALDAESEGEEGKFYRWEKSELEKVLSTEEFEFYSAIYGINEEPNFEEKYYAPQLEESLDKLAKKNSVSVADLKTRLRSINDKLLAERGKRVRPLLDNKILTGWNGLMIRGLADAGRILERPEYIKVAEKAADFLWDNSRVDGRLMRTFTDGKARLNGYLDDYAFLIDGYLGLHEATGNEKWLTRADELQKKQNELYWDAKAGGFFFTSSDHEALLVRSRNLADGALPAGNSVSMTNLLYLAKALDIPDYKNRVEKTLQGTSSLLNEFPTNAPRLIVPVIELSKR